MINKDQLFKRFSNAESKRTNWKDTYREALEFFSPQRDTYDTPTNGEKRTNNDKIFDSTPQEALQKAVSNVQSSIFPPQKRWAKLKIGPILTEIFDEQGGQSKKQEAEKQLEKITKTFFAALHKSNFDLVSSEFIEDWLIGTGSMMLHKGTRENPFIFEAVPLNEVYLERGQGGKIGGRFRKWELPCELIEKTWPDAKLPQSLLEQKTNKPYDNVAVIEYTVEDKINNRKYVEKEGKSILASEQIDGFKYIVQLEKTKDIIVGRETKSHPHISARYAVSAGEVYGRGPVLSALADAKTLNKTKELILKNAALAVTGMYTVVDDGIINLENIQMQPGALIPVSQNPGSPMGPTLSRLPSAADFNVAQLIIEDLRKSIKSILLVDPLGEIDAPVKSATEISIRAQSVAKSYGSAYGRMQQEGAEQIMTRGLHILNELGLVDLENFIIDGSHIAVQHVSPLAIAQDQDDLSNLTRFAEVISNFFGPEALMMMTNPLEFSKEIAKLIGISTDILPTQEQLDILKSAAQQEAQAGQPPQQ